MSIQRQIVPVPLATGIDTNVDPKQLQAKLLKCENGYVARQGVVDKRHGTAHAAGTYAAESFITKHKDRPVLLGQNALRIYDGGELLTGAFDRSPELTPSPLHFCDINPEHISATAGDTYYHPDIAETPTVRAISYTAYRVVSGTLTFVPCLETFDKATGLQLDKLEGASGGTSTTHSRRFRLVEADGTICAFYMKVASDEYVAVYEVSGTTGLITGPATTSAIWPAVLSPDENMFDACLIEGDYSTTIDNVAIVYPSISGIAVLVGRYIPGTGFATPYGTIVVSGTVNAVGCSPWGLLTAPSLTPGLFGVWYALADGES